MRYMCQIRDITYTSSTQSIPQADWSDAEIKSYNMFKVYGCDAYYWIDLKAKDHSSKLDFKADKGIFVGVDVHSNGYLIYFPSIKLILPRRDVLFDERWIEDSKPVPSSLAVDLPKDVHDVVTALDPRKRTELEAAQQQAIMDADMYNDSDD